MKNPFGDYWKPNYLKAIRLAYKRGHISKASYYGLKREVE